MNTVETSIDLSLFLPEKLNADLQSPRFIEDVEKLGTSKTTAKMLAGLHSYVNEQWIDDYDLLCLPLDEALAERRANCLTETALASLCGRIIDLDLIPTIENYRRNPNDKPSMHGYITTINKEGVVVKSDDNSYAETTAYGTFPHESGIDKIEFTLVTNREYLSHNGVFQIRADNDGNLEVLFDEDTTRPDTDWRSRFRYTFFPGERGLKSYLKTIDKVSAMLRKKSPKILIDQLAPRL